MRTKNAEQPSERRRDIVVLYLISSAFFVLTIVTAIICATAKLQQNTSKGLETLSIVSGCAAAVLFSWAFWLSTRDLRDACLGGVTEFWRSAIGLLRPFRWTFTPRRCAAYVATAAVVTIATHFALLYYLSLKMPVGKEYYRKQYNVLAPRRADGRPYDYARILALNERKPLQISIAPAIKDEFTYGINWYRKYEIKLQYESTLRALEADGYSEKVFVAELERCYELYDQLGALEPAALNKFGTAIVSLPRLTLKHENSVCSVCISSLNPLRCGTPAILFNFHELEKVRFARNGNVFWARFDNPVRFGTSNFILIDMQRELCVTLPVVFKGCGCRGGPTLFSSLPVCLVAIAGSWLLALAPFFYLCRPRILPE